MKRSKPDDDLHSNLDDALIFIKRMTICSGSWLLFSWLVFSMTKHIGAEVDVPSWMKAMHLHLPHGILVVAAWLFGWRSVLMVTPGVFVGLYTYIGGFVDVPRIALLALIATCSAPLAFSALRFATSHAIRFQDVKMHWRFVLVGGTLSAAVTSILCSVTLYSLVHGNMVVLDTIASITTKLVGLLVLAATLWVSIRHFSHLLRYL